MTQTIEKQVHLCNRIDQWFARSQALSWEKSLPAQLQPLLYCPFAITRRDAEMLLKGLEEVATTYGAMFTRTQNSKHGGRISNDILTALDDGATAMSIHWLADLPTFHVQPWDRTAVVKCISTGQ